MDNDSLGSPSNDSDQNLRAKTLLTLDRGLVDLALTANGKVELYFHAYFWYTFALNLYQESDQTPEAESSFD